MIEKTPEKLIRFYGNINYALEVIELNEITFTHVDTFNDPFDPFFEFITECEGDYKKLNSWLEKNGSNYTATEENFNETLEKLSKFHINFRNSSFALCLSANDLLSHNKDIKQNNLYMWGHYANGHKGIVIEFYYNKLKSFYGDSLYPIKYKDKIPKIMNSHFQLLAERNSTARTKFEKQIKDRWEIKSQNWKPENEWRVLVTNETSKLPYIKFDKSGLTKLPDGAISTVYIGCKMSASDKQKIKEQTIKHQSQAKIYEAEPSKTSFELNYKDITND